MARRKSTTKRRRTAIKRRKKLMFLPWPAATLVVLSVGVVLLGWTFLASANDVVVTARVPAPLPTSPAAIESPTDGGHFSSVPVTVSGSCPADGSGSYIKLFRNNIFSGVALCSAGNTFQLSTDLYPGANVLKATIFNKTDDAGADSNTPTVFYDPPQPLPVTPPANPTNATTVVAPPFTISTNFKYIGYYPGQRIQWQLQVDGGYPPYAININWGDNKNTVISKTSSGILIIEHEYSKPGGFKGSYKISITGSDSVGNQTSLQLFALVNSPAVGSITGTTIKPSPFSSTKNWLWLAWPAYAGLLLMYISFWLGEHEELIILRKKGKLRQRRT